MPVWQRVYEEINDPDFVLICAAQDTGGEAVAGPIFDAASPAYVQVVDEDHGISSAGETFREVVMDHANRGKDYYRPLDLEQA